MFISAFWCIILLYQTEISVGSVKGCFLLNSVIEKRRNFIINAVYFLILFAVGYCAFKYCLPLVLPFLFAFLIASVIDRPISAIARKVHAKRSFVSLLFILLMIVAIAAVFFLIGIELFQRISDFYNYVAVQLQNLTSLINSLKLWILDITVFLPAAIRSVLHENVTLFFDNIIQNGFNNISIDTSMINWSELLSKGGQVISGTVGKIPSAFISFIIFVISTVFISSDYDTIREFFVNQLETRHLNKITRGWQLGVSTLKKMFKAYGLIILITTFELTVGLYILKFIGVLDIPYIIFIAFAIAVIDIIPVLGTGTVLIPWAVISFIMGNIGLGIGVLVLYIVILVIRQIIEPKLVAGQVGLPAIVTIIAMYVGSKTMGVLGFFILPFIVILIKVFSDAGIINIGKNKQVDKKEIKAEE